MSNESKNNGAWHGGKGSKIRSSSSLKNYSDGWDRIFGEKNNKEKETKPEEYSKEKTGSVIKRIMR